MSRITINGVSMDPSAPPATLKAMGVAPAIHAEHTNHILIQTDDPLTPDQREILAGIGVVVEEYVPDDTYICEFKPTDLGPVRALDFVSWADVFHRAFKVGPDLQPPAPDVETALRVTAGHAPAPSRKPRLVDVVLHQGVDDQSKKANEAIAAAAGIDPSTLQPGRRKVRIRVESGQLPALANIDDVRRIEPVPERQLFNNVARPILHADVVVNATDYRGDGEVIAVADTGFDAGSASNVHPAFAGRVAKLYPLGRPKADDPHGHGTHVAGSVLGDGNSPAMGGQIQGTAPAATLVLQSTLDATGGLGGIPSDLHDLFEPPYLNDGARVHTNSWGSTTPGTPYDTSAEEIDDVVWNHPDLVICFAAGNDGTDANDNGIVDNGSIGSQSAAKNCITIGASENQRPEFEHTYGEYWPGDFPAAPLSEDLQANDPDGLVAFSSRGPTKEHRIKPDVVAPGTCILSTRSRHLAGSPPPFGTSTDDLFMFSSGTSMATPLAAGCAAVLRETLVKNGMPKPAAALVKALMINGAVPLSGQYTPTEAGSSPNNNSGWGRIDLAGSVIVPGQDANGGFEQGGPLEQGESFTFELDIPSGHPEHPEKIGGDYGRKTNGNAAGGPTFKITLVWSDPPGAALQNDLDLIVVGADGTERHGNMGKRKGFDRTNNVEQVLWTNMPAGPAKITIHAHRITKFPQPWAYAWKLS